MTESTMDPLGEVYVGQKLYYYTRSGERGAPRTYQPVTVVNIFPHVIIVEDEYGFKSGIPRMSAEQSLSRTPIGKRRPRGGFTK